MQSADDLSEVVIEQWRRRIRISTAANYHYEMGSAIARSGNLDDAIEQMRKATHLAPDHLAAAFKLESLLVSRGLPVTDTERLDPDQRLRGFVQHMARSLEDGRYADLSAAAISDSGLQGPIVECLRALAAFLAKGEAVPRLPVPVTDVMVEILRPTHRLVLTVAQKCLSVVEPAAIDYFQLYSALEPDDPAGVQGLANALLMARHHDELRRLIGTLPNTGAQPIRQRAMLWIGLDEGEKALAELDGLQEEKSHGVSLALRACALMLLGRYDEALVWLQQAEEALPNFPWTIVTRGWFETGGVHPVRLDAAVPGILTVLARLPDRVATLLNAR